MAQKSLFSSLHSSLPDVGAPSVPDLGQALVINSTAPQGSPAEKSHPPPLPSTVGAWVDRAGRGFNYSPVK